MQNNEINRAQLPIYTKIHADALKQAYVYWARTVFINFLLYLSIATTPSHLHTDHTNLWHTCITVYPFYLPVISFDDFSPQFDESLQSLPLIFMCTEKSKGIMSAHVRIASNKQKCHNSSSYGDNTYSSVQKNVH
jgi:hypothetical protein